MKNNKAFKEIGHIYSFYKGIGLVKGLPYVFLHELLLDKNKNPIGIVIGFDKDFVEVLFFKEEIDLNLEISRSYNKFSIPVSFDYIGRVVNGIGEPLDGLGEIKGEKRYIFSQAPEILQREPIKTPLITGIKIIDTTLPIGRGQKELIIGDRNLGKSTIAIDTVLNQKYANPKVYCIYVLCSQKEEKLKELIHIFKKHGAFLYSTVIGATSNSPLAIQYLAPFIGTTIAEFLRDKGKDVLIIYDDLSSHAKIYRTISLLLERAPGREAYPGDIFYLHAQLLERSGKLKNKGSITVLPIAETLEGDISSYISTNLISITDGQIYLERGLFQKGFLPAINVGLSVSRIGARAQPELLREVTKGIRLSLSQHKELQKLTQLETVVSKEAKKKIKRGDLILEVLKQEQHSYFSPEEQAILFYLVEEGYFDDLKSYQWKEFEELIIELLRTRYRDLKNALKKGKFTDNIKKKLTSLCNEIKKEFLIQKNGDIY